VRNPGTSSPQRKSCRPASPARRGPGRNPETPEASPFAPTSDRNDSRSNARGHPLVFPDAIRDHDRPAGPHAPSAARRRLRRRDLAPYGRRTRPRRRCTGCSLPQARGTGSAADDSRLPRGSDGVRRFRKIRGIRAVSKSGESCEVCERLAHRRRPNQPTGRPLVDGLPKRYGPGRPVAQFAGFAKTCRLALRAHPRERDRPPAWNHGGRAGGRRDWRIGVFRSVVIPGVSSA
jgi:hypothetical protein